MLVWPNPKHLYIALTQLEMPHREGGGKGTSLQEANGKVPLDGVAFSIELLDWCRRLSDFLG